MKRDFLTIKDLSKDEILEIFKLASQVKKARYAQKRPLSGRSVGLIFEKPSTRTRVSFDVGIYELGGHSIYLSSEEIRLGEREAIKDAAKVLSRYLSALVVRTFSHRRLIEISRYADIPVINGLTDFLHPCQAMSDLFTIMEKKGLEGTVISFVGDGNNVLHSLIYGCARLGLRLNIATPAGYEPDKEVVKDGGGALKLFTSPARAVRDADIIYTDVWTSMGQEGEKEKRLRDFKGYQLDMKLLSLAKKDALVMHCLPAHRGEEVTDEVLDSPQSVVIDQAENRLHVQKAILIKLLEGER